MDYMFLCTARLQPPQLISLRGRKEPMQINVVVYSVPRAAPRYQLQRPHGVYVWK